ncbi:hypothetical protein CPB84DRAFT_1965095, partial [Gymnopilus junonius]
MLDRKRPLPFPEYALSDSDQKKLDEINKNVERAQLICELEEIKRLIPVYEDRRQFIKRIPNFWAIAFWRHVGLATDLQHEEDMAILKHLVDVWINRNPIEPRAYTIEFTFSVNPYFENRILKKVYKFTESAARKKEVADKEGFKWSMLDFDWDDDVKPLPEKILWKPGQNVCQKYPAIRDKDNEITDLGSFFNWFEADGDPFDIGLIISEEIFEDAVDHFTGQVNEEEDEEEDEDMN